MHVVKYSILLALLCSLITFAPSIRFYGGYIEMKFAWKKINLTTMLKFWWKFDEETLIIFATGKVTKTNDDAFKLRRQDFSVTWNLDQFVEIEENSSFLWKTVWTYIYANLNVVCDYMKCLFLKGMFSEGMRSKWKKAISSESKNNKQKAAFVPLDFIISINNK